MEALIGAIVGGVIGFLSSYFTMKYQHRLATEQKKEDEVKRLTAEVESYVIFLGNIQKKCALSKYSLAQRAKEASLFNKETFAKTTFLNEENPKISLERDILYTSEKTHAFVEKLCMLCKLKNIDSKNIVEKVWSLEIDVEDYINRANDSVISGVLYDVEDDLRDKLPRLESNYVRDLKEIINEITG